MTLPDGRDPSATQATLMNTDWSATGVTAEGTKGTIGLYGYEKKGEHDTCPWGEKDCSDEYYLYIKFKPYDNVTFKKQDEFRLLFQNGDEKSDWSGVEYINKFGSMEVDTDLIPVSVKNKHIVTREHYGNDSYYRGYM